jgi:hypothetical protein
MSAQGQQPQAGQAGQAQQAAQQQAQQHDPQALAAAAQFGQLAQQHGLNMGQMFGLWRFVQDNLPQIVALVQGFVGAVGPGSRGTVRAVSTRSRLKRREKWARLKSSRCGR